MVTPIVHLGIIYEGCHNVMLWNPACYIHSVDLLHIAQAIDLTKPPFAQHSDIAVSHCATLDCVQLCRVVCSSFAWHCRP